MTNTRYTGRRHDSSRPRWDDLALTLTFRRTIVREPTRKSAPLVEAILRAFEAARWARFVRDPLPPQHPNPHQRLIEAVRRLNKSLKGDLIYFHLRDSVIAWEDTVTGRRGETERTAS